MAKGIIHETADTISRKRKLIVSDPTGTQYKIGESILAETLVEAVPGNYVEWALLENENKEIVPTVTKVLAQGRVITSNTSNLIVAKDDAVVVTNGASITGTTLIDGGNLLVLKNSKAAGNLQAKNSAFVYCENSTISGNDFKVDGSNAVIIMINCKINGKFNSGSNRLVRLVGNESKSILSTNDTDVEIKQNRINGDLSVTGATNRGIADNIVSGSTHNG